MANKEKSIEELEKEFEIAREALTTAKRIQAQKEVEEAERKQAELAAVKEKRYKEIQDAEKKLVELKTAYIKDYGSYCTTGSYDNNVILSLLHWML